MKILLLTTCICNDENIKDLKRLILSINSVRNIQFVHYVLEYLIKSYIWLSMRLHEIQAHGQYDLNIAV